MKRKTKARRRTPVAPLTVREKITLAQFDRVCTYIYGERWQAPLSRALGVNERTVRTWVGGRSRISANVGRQVEGLLEDKLGRADAVREVMARCLRDLPEED